MYDGVLALAFVAASMVLAVLVLHWLSVVSRQPWEGMPFLSGHDPTEHALSRYHVRWYLATLVFLAFDVEMLFMYPWAVVVGRLGVGAVVEMFLFLGALLLAVFWARREGAFRWS